MFYTRRITGDRRISLGSFITLIAFLCLSVIAVPATTLYATTVSNDLVSFDSGDPCSIISSVRINGLQDGEDILGIDFRPATGELYALGSSSRLYVIDTFSGAATPLSAGPFSPLLEGGSFGFDFNPTVDRIRIISNVGQNLRANPTTGAIAVVDLMLDFTGTDANFGIQPYAVGAAYTNPDNDPTTGTTLYDIDSSLDILVSQVPPNDGKLNTLASLGINANELAGFDISISNTAYAALLESGVTRPKGGQCGTTSLFTIDLIAGTAVRVGSIGTKQPVRGLAVVLAAQE